jgi:predicted ATPase
MVDGKPTVMWIDDAHWLDPSSAELLPRIIERVAHAPVLLLLTTRSFPKGPALPAPEHVFHLEQLQREQCLELAKSVPGAQAVSEDLLARAAAASDGNPLFMEQLVISLVSQGARAGGRRRMSDDLPLTLADMMSERLDRLEGGRRVVQAAACIGRSFAPDFLARCWRTPTPRSSSRWRRWSRPRSCGGTRTTAGRPTNSVMFCCSASPMNR